MVGVQGWWVGDGGGPGVGGYGDGRYPGVGR